MTPPIVVGVDPRRHDPEAPVLAALLARAIGAPVVAAAVHPHEAQRLRGSALARLAAVEAAFHGVELETVAVAAAGSGLAGLGVAETAAFVAAAAVLLYAGFTHAGGSRAV